MKPINSVICGVIRCRPFTGAWIETVIPVPRPKRALGRPFTGAWIETVHLAALVFDPQSPLHGGVD